LAYAILEEQNAGQFVLGHVGPNHYNFSDKYSAYRTFFHHEDCHLILGMSHLKRGYNPLPFEYGYNGNGMAESLIISIQDSFDRGGKHCHQSKKSYVSTVLRRVTEEKGNMLDSAISTAKACDGSETLTTMFEERRKMQFMRPDKGEGLGFKSMAKKPSKKTKWGEKNYRGQPLARHIAEQFYDDFQPEYRLADRNYGRLMRDDRFEFVDNINARRDYLKTVPVDVMWDAMNNPDQDIDLDHTKTMTWEFILLYDSDFEFFQKIVGLRNVRDAIGYDKLAKSIDYNNYRLFKDNVEVIKRELKIVGNGNLIHQQSDGEEYQTFIKRAISINARPAEIYMGLAKSLVKGGTSRFYSIALIIFSAMALASPNNIIVFSLKNNGLSTPAYPVPNDRLINRTVLAFSTSKIGIP